MAGTPEEDLLAWLEREEQNLGFTTVEGGLENLTKARALFYDELGYDITESQFAALKDSQILRYSELPMIGAAYDRVEQAWGWQPVFRIKGRFASWEQVQELRQAQK